MKITVMGTGRMGSAIATALATRTSHAVGVRGSNAKSRSAKGLAQQLKVAVATDAALLASDVILLTVPWAALATAASELKSYSGLVVSAVVPWSDGAGPVTESGSAAERIASLLPAAKVATAFTSVSSILVRDPGSGEKPSIFVCCDYDTHKKRVMDLVQEVGFEPVDAGNLTAARDVEGLGLIVLHLAYTAGYGDRVSFKVTVFP
jgi:predicted dinucleotide-binding enzyme